jgi:hypothetical protein
MPIQLRVIAIVLSVVFLFYTIILVRRDRAEVRHMLKWVVMALVVLAGSIFNQAGMDLAHFLGIRTLSVLMIFVLLGALVVITLKYQMSLASADKQITKLIQEVSIMKSKLEQAEAEQAGEAND